MLNLQVILKNFLVALVLVAFYSTHGLCQSAESAQDTDFSQRAKLKQYPGGPDESELKVQAVLSIPTRKFAPQVEKIDESPVEETEQ
jgi:hypothetical protein